MSNYPLYFSDKHLSWIPRETAGEIIPGMHDKGSKAKKHKKRFHCLNRRKQNPYVAVRMARILE